MFKLKFKAEINKPSKGVLFHSDMTGNSFVIYSEKENPNLKKLAYQAFDVLMGTDPSVKGLNENELYDKYVEFLKAHNLEDAITENGSLYEVTKEDLINDLEFETGLDIDEIDPYMIDESKIGWYVYGEKIDVIDSYKSRF